MAFGLPWFATVPRIKGNKNGRNHPFDKIWGYETVISSSCFLFLFLLLLLLVLLLLLLLLLMPLLPQKNGRSITSKYDVVRVVL